MMLRYIFIVLIIVLFVFGLISYILIRVLRIFSKFNSVFDQTRKETNKSDEIVYKNENVVILKGEAGRKKHTNKENE